MDQRALGIFKSQATVSDVCGLGQTDQMKPLREGSPISL